MRTNKAAALGTAEALQRGGDGMIDMIHKFCILFIIGTVTHVIIPLPKKGYLSLMTNYRGTVNRGYFATFYFSDILMVRPTVFLCLHEILHRIGVLLG